MENLPGSLCSSIQKLNDPRYAFMFKPRLYIHSASLAELLTTMFGPNAGSKITIMDMSGVPFDIVNTVVSLMARLAFDFNFWNINRRECPILLVFGRSAQLFINNNRRNAVSQTHCRTYPQKKAENMG